MASPVADTYVTTSGGQIAGGRNVFFSDGAAAGSYNAGTNTWTPGRDASGVVTKASFSLVPKETWVQIAGSSFVSNVQPLLSAALPAYNDPGASDLADVLDDYSGLAHDVAGGRVFFHGGGHQGSANNGLYRLDLKKMAYAIAKLPDMQTYWPANYKTNPPRDNSYTIYTRAQDFVSANPATVAAYYDMFYDDVEPLADTRNPTARHTYEAMTFHGGKLRHGVRQYWEWDEATGNWSRAFPFDKTATQHGQAGGGLTGEMTKGTWDEVRNRYLCGPFWNGTPGGIWAKNADGSWSWPASLPSSWVGYVSTACRMGRKWCFFARPNVDNANFWPPVLRLFDLDTDTVQNVTLSGLDQNRCIHSSKSDEASFMAYVPAVGKILLLMPYDLADAYAADAHLPLVAFWIDPATGIVTQETQAGAFPSLWSWDLVKNKLFWIPQISTLCLIDKSNSNVRIRKF